VGILDALTGNASKAATKQATATLGNAANAAATGIYQGRDLANGVLESAMSSIGQGTTQARGDLTSGAATATGLLGQAGSVYDPLVAGGGAAYGRLLDATGANGAEGSERATTAFRAAPGYEYARDEALGSIQRAAGARGDLAGGNATMDLLKASTGLADQSYQQYVNNLSGLQGGYLAGLGGQAGALTGQAGVASSTGGALANTAMQGAAGRAGLESAIAGNIYNAGTAVAGQGTQIAGSIADTLQKGAKAQEQASANVLGLGSNLIGGISNFVGGNGISNLTNLFK